MNGVLAAGEVHNTAGKPNWQHSAGGRVKGSLQAFSPDDVVN